MSTEHVKALFYSQVLVEFLNAHILKGTLMSNIGTFWSPAARFDSWKLQKQATENLNGFIRIEVMRNQHEAVSLPICLSSIKDKDIMQKRLKLRTAKTVVARNEYKSETQHTLKHRGNFHKTRSHCNLPLFYEDIEDQITTKLSQTSRVGVNRSNVAGSIQVACAIIWTNELGP